MADGSQKGRLRSVGVHAAESLRTNSAHVVHCQKPLSEASSGSAGSADAQEPCKWQQQQQDAGWSFSRVDYDVLTNVLLTAGASMADPLMSLVDTAFVGRLGLLPLAGLGPNAALFNVLFFLCFTPLAVMCTQSMAAANSRGDLEGVGRGFVQALTAMAGVSSLLVLVLLAAPERVLGLFLANAEIMPFAKTYLTIRALSLPAALTMSVCQAAFRSLLELKTPFFVVMTASAANLLLDELFMFRLGGGIAGCGWASVVSQYIGALLFATCIYKRRHQFGLLAALNAAPARFHSHYGTSRSGLLPSSYGGAGKTGSGRNMPAVVQQLLQPLRPASVVGGAGAAPGGGSGSGGAAEAVPLLAGGRRPGGVVKYEKNSDSGDESPKQVDCSSGDFNNGWQFMDGSHHGSQAGQQQQQQLGEEAYAYYQQQQQQQQQHPGQQLGRRRTSDSAAIPGLASAVAAAATLRSPTPPPGIGAGGGSSAASSNGGSSGSSAGHPDHDEVHAPMLGSLRRSARVSSDSKLLRNTGPTWYQRLAMLVLALEWKAFNQRFAALTTRGLLILSTYTSASVVAARSGTSMIAGHQVVQQQQQMQMSVAWSFLHVGQSMTANLYHSSLPLGPKAARKLATRIVSWAAFLCVTLAGLTWVFQRQISRLFVRDAGVLQLVASAAVPATLMLSTAWNNALEGCLLGADDNAYVVKVYPVAVAFCLAELAYTASTGKALTGVWWGLFLYYLVLLLGFAHRFWFRRGRL